MQLVDMFFDEIEDAKKRRVPFCIPIGTIEYHAHNASCGTDTMVIDGCLRELGKKKEIVVCPPIWYGVASYAVGGPETGTIQVDEDAYTNYIYCILKSMIYGGVKNIYCIAHHQTEEAGLMVTIKINNQTVEVPEKSTILEATRIAGMYAGNLIGTFLSLLLSGGQAQNALYSFIQTDSPVKIVVIVFLAPVIEEFVFRKKLIDRARRYGEKSAMP